MLSRLLFYLVIKPISLLPFSILYGISNFLFFVLYGIIGYRKEVVTRNLQQSFPEKSTTEINEVAKQFYKHLADIIVESVKFFSISKGQALKRFEVKNPEVLDAFADKGQSVIIVGGHYSNWEIIAISLDLFIKHQTVALYSKLSNDFFNGVMLKSRGRYGIKMVTTKDSGRYFKEESGQTTATVFGADQSPTHNKNVIWTTFLNQETAIAFGTERYATQFNYPVVYGAIQRTKRGHYNFELSLITDDPSKMAHGEITLAHANMLEKQIKADPAYWLWTHKRWKRKKKQDEVVMTKS
ncbi:MAG: KDO2-lipid IV(A) lauroyltransferase [Bacteroidia bacterium]|jgi:KDO2-lipid IV(A) lauroyltransferase